MRKVKIMWSLRGRVVVDVPDDADLGDKDAIHDALQVAVDAGMVDVEADSDGDEIDDWGEVDA